MPQIKGFEDQATINLFLPSNNAAERLAISKIITRLRRRYGGLTYSRSAQPVFSGYWHTMRNGRRVWVRDEITWVLVDTTEDVEDVKFQQYLIQLKQAVHDEYQKVQRPQDEVWVIVRDGYRVVG